MRFNALYINLKISFFCRIIIIQPSIFVEQLHHISGNKIFYILFYVQQEVIEKGCMKPLTLEHPTKSILPKVSRTTILKK